MGPIPCLEAPFEIQSTHPRRLHNPERGKSESGPWPQKTSNDVEDSLRGSEIGTLHDPEDTLERIELTDP